MFFVNATYKLLSVQKMKIQRTFQVALVIETVVSVSITGKFETLGSNFSQEIRKAKLLASIATAPKVRCILILIKAENNLFMKFTSFTLLEVVDKSLVFLYLIVCKPVPRHGSQLKKERIVQHEL